MNNTSIKLTDIVPNSIGMIAFDENCQVVDVAGIAKDRLNDISQIAQVELDEEGFGLIQERDIQIIIYKQDKKTIAVYTYSPK